MTIDEIIAKEKEIADGFQNTVDTHMVNSGCSLEEMYCDDTEVIEEQLKRCKELSDYHNTIANTMRKYQMFQAKYVERLKADMVAMLEELQLEIDEKATELCDDGWWLTYNDIIQQKINKLKEEKDE